MTLLLSWIGKDSRKISSFYIASDSRISWNNSTKFDFGRKVFAFSNSADIIGYCGDVLYPIIVLNQLMEMENKNLLFPVNAKKEERSRIIFSELQNKFKEYPSEIVMDQTLKIIHVSRDNNIDFSCNLYSWSRKSGWELEIIKIPNSSDKVIVLGSGADEFRKRYLEYLKGLNGKTSRALFQCLCHSLLKIKDLRCGGAPQLVGLYNKFNGRNFGVIYNEKRYFLGRELNSIENINDIEWRNENFERCEGQSKRRINEAQRQPDELRD